MRNEKIGMFVSQIIQLAIEKNIYPDPEVKDILMFAIRRASEGYNNLHAHTDFISKNVKEPSEDLSDSKYHSYCKKIYSHEHIVPPSAIYEYIVANIVKRKKSTVKIIYQCLKKFCITATITKDENIILNKNGLRKFMPSEFYDKNSDLYNDPFARYKKANIYKNLKKRSKIK